MFVNYTYLTLLLFLVNMSLFAQLRESFTDGNFTTQPEWRSRQPDDWIVSATKQLQSNNTIANDVFWISTRNELSMETEWTMNVQLEFNPSSANYMDVYLTASEMNLSSTTTTGYFIRIGNSEDEVSLYRKDADNRILKLIDGKNGVLNNSNNIVQVKVWRDQNGKWFLFVKHQPSQEYILEGTAADTTYTSSLWFGLLVKQSTAGFFQKHFLDDLEIKPLIPDASAPAFVLGYYNSDSVLYLQFDEPLNTERIPKLIEWEMNNGMGNPSAIRMNKNEIGLQFARKMEAAVTYRLTIPPIEDILENRSETGFYSFTYTPPAAHDIVLSEIMADPSPPRGLPEVEWIEIQNRSQRIIPLHNWRIGDNNSTSKPFPPIILRPDSSLIITATAAAYLLQAYGQVIGIDGFPSLNNDADVITLYNENGQRVHTVGYSENWYRNVMKQEGGWSLEMIDVHNPCGGADNWIAGMHPFGGTPGKPNSVKTNNPDTEPPFLQHAFASDSITVRLYFNEPLDSSSASLPSRYTIDGGIGNPSIAIPEGPFFSTVRLTLPAPLQRTKLYRAEVQAITDCTGNTIGDFNQDSVGLTETCLPGEIRINEILFDPKGDGSDYVEIVNHSSKRYNLKSLFIANRNSAGGIGEKTMISPEDHLLLPGEYAVLCRNRKEIILVFPTHDKKALFATAQLPSFPNDKGTVVLMNADGMIIDEVSYEDDWHFPLLSNREGVALERIRIDAPSQQKDNWISAAQDVGYGTPGLRNSQYRRELKIQGAVESDLQIFSPDQDGQDDFLTMRYRFGENGYVLSCKVFDAGGNCVRYLQRNLLCGLIGSFRWDGLNDKQQPLSTGPYFLVTDVFHLSGKTKRFTNRVVLARRR